MECSFDKISFMNNETYGQIEHSHEVLYAVRNTSSYSMFPDNSRAIELTSTKPYIVGKDALADFKVGWLRVGLNARSLNGRDPYLILDVDGISFYISYFGAFTMLFLGEGTKFSLNYITSKVNYHFIPIQGVS